MRNSRIRFKRSAIATSISLIFINIPVWANPTGPQVVNGLATFQRPDAGTLNITNSPGAIINWQGFSISAGELTRFIQQSASSSVLNRVVGSDISQIYGQLTSNGRVFLINPSGILIGPGAVVDTAGFVASTLNMMDADFLAGKLKFQGDSTSGSIVNQGWIRTGYGGQVILVAPQIENSGLIHTPGGELILAAGQKLTVTSADLEGVQFEVQAPTDSVVNVGKLLADGGAVGVFAGTLKHSGEIRANALVRDEAGQIVLKAQSDIQIASGSTTVADGKTGGGITIQSTGENTRVAGYVSAQGTAGQGGDIRLLGNGVSVVESAVVDASGSAGGGQILVGGDYQGSNSSIQNSSNTFVGSAATLRADATGSGDGGRIIVWSDDKTQFYGSLSAQGGPDGGNGGFAEVSGKQNLIFDGGANLGAPKGSLGNLLLDPLDLYVFNGGGVLYDTVNDLTEFPTNAATVSPATLAAVTGNVSLNASRFMRINDPITLTTAGQGLTAQVATYTPPALPDPLALSSGVPNRLDIGANITTNGGAVSLNAPAIQSFATSTIATAGAPISVTATAGAIQASQLSLNAGSGAITANSSTSFIQFGNISGGSFTATAPSFIGTGTITTNGGAATLTSSGSFISTSDITSGGGAVTANAAFSVGTGNITTTGGSVTLVGTSSSIFTGNISAGAAPVSLSGTSVFTNTIDTTGAVTLTATRGSIFSTVNNASSVVASATNSSSSASVNLSSATVLNATNVGATTTQCSTNGFCSGASVSLSGDQGVNVGTVAASAPTNFTITASPSLGATFEDQRFENRSESVNIFSSSGPIRAMSGSSSITATDVSLGTGLLSGGGIGVLSGTPLPLNVNVTRIFSFNPNGEFNVQLTGSGPNNLNMQIGVAPTGQSYSGALSKTGLALNVSANDTTVTASNFDISSGFDQRVFNVSPAVSLDVPNGKLVATTVSMPKGDVTGTASPSARRNCDVFGGAFCPPPLTIEPLLVTLRASQDLQVDSYTRAVGTIAKSSTFESDSGSVTLGTINANKDSVSASSFVNASVSDLTTTGFASVFADTGNVTLSNFSSAGASISSIAGNVSISNLSSSGSVSVFSGSGNVTVDRIDTTSGTGSASITATGAAAGVVKAQTDGVGVEITSGGPISISATTIGDGTFTNPLDVAGSSVSLTSFNGGSIGFTGKPIVANTQNLTVNAASGSNFNVDTGATALKNLTVTASPTAVGNGGLAQVSSEAKTYAFASDGANFTFNPGAIPATQFNNGQLNFTSTSGDITLGNLDIGATGTLSITAPAGSIAAGTLDGGAINLTAGTVSGAAVSVLTGDIGGTNRPNSVQITSGNNGFFTQRSGSVETGTINAGDVTINSFNGNIKIGPSGTDDVGSSGTPAGRVSLTANSNGFGGSGTIQIGNVFASSISLRSPDNSITTGALDATTSFSAISNVSVTTGTLDSPSITIFKDCLFCSLPEISTGAIGSTRPATNILIAGSTTTINGAVTGNPSAVDNFSLSANGGGSNGGLLTVNGAITAGDGSFIGIGSASTTSPYQFTTINAGTTGTVGIGSNNDIRQQFGGGGITAQTVQLSAGGDVHGLDSSGGAVNLDLIGVKDLTVGTGGFVKLNANGSQLDALSITTNSTGPDVGGISLTNMGGSQSLTVSDLGNGDFNVALSSPSNPLNFTFNANSTGIRTAGSGIVTSGGSVNLRTTGNLTTGTINTKSGATTVPDGSITLEANQSLNVSGTVDSGSNTIFASGASVTGAGQLVSTNNVFVEAFSGNIGTGASPLAVSAPNATLEAFGTNPSGNIFAALTGTTHLTLNANDGFTVSSTVPLTSLDLTTRGDGIGPVSLVTDGTQSYGFVRNGTTLEVTGVTSTAPLSSFSLDVNSGNLTAKGGIAANALSFFTSGTLTLDGSTSALTLSNVSQNLFGSSGVVIQGDVTASATTSQSIFTFGNLSFTGKGTLSSTGATASQNITAFGNLDFIAQGGAISVQGTNQSISGFGGSSIMTLQGGAGASQSVTFAGTSQQTIQTTDSGTSSIRLLGGSGTGASASIVYSGSGTQSVQGGSIVMTGGSATGASALITTATGAQQIRATTNITLTGGTASGADARIENTSTNQQRVGETEFTPFCCTNPYQTDNVILQGGTGAEAAIVASGLQKIQANTAIQVKGGSGSGGDARIENTSAANEQRIGCNSGFGLDSCSSFVQTLDVTAGANGAFAQIVAAGTQRLRGTSNLTLTGDNTDGGFARISGAGSLQSIQFGNTVLTAGQGNGSNAEILYSGTQSQSLQLGSLTLTGKGTAGGNTAVARIASPSATSQSISGSGITMSGGAGPNSNAEITTAGQQSLSFFGTSAITGGAGSGSVAQITAGGQQNLFLGSLTMSGGAGAGSFALISTPGNQTLNYSSLNMSAATGGSGSFVEIQAGGTQNLTGFGAFNMTAGRAPDTDAIIEGNSQTINGGLMTLTGGTGTSGNTSDAVIRNLSGNQAILNTSGITLNGGTDFSTTGILNLGTGTQRITSSGALTLASNAASTAAAPVQVINSAATLQTVDVQRVNLQTSGGGEATLSSAGDQYIHTNNTTANPSIRVAALGSGTASIQATGSQLLEVDYPQLMQATRNGLLSVGDASAIGTSLIQATDQNVFAGSIRVQGGSGAGSLSKLSADNTQTISTLTGGIQVLGGSGTDSLATIDPLTQIILSNGTVSLIGGQGPGTNADASIISAGDQTIVSTNGSISLTGGLTSGSDAIISNLLSQAGCSVFSVLCGSSQTLIASGGIILAQDTGSAIISGGQASNLAPTGFLLTTDATQQTLTGLDRFTWTFDTLAIGTEEPGVITRVPICR